MGIPTIMSTKKSKIKDAKETQKQPDQPKKISKTKEAELLAKTFQESLTIDDLPKFPRSRDQFPKNLKFLQINNCQSDSKNKFNQFNFIHREKLFANLSKRGYFENLSNCDLSSNALVKIPSALAGCPSKKLILADNLIEDLGNSSSGFLDRLSGVSGTSQNRITPH